MTFIKVIHLLCIWRKVNAISLNFIFNLFLNKLNLDNTQYCYVYVKLKIVSEFHYAGNWKCLIKTKSLKLIMYRWMIWLYRAKEKLWLKISLEICLEMLRYREISLWNISIKHITRELFWSLGVTLFIFFHETCLSRTLFTTIVAPHFANTSRNFYNVIKIIFVYFITKLN